jgi:tetratricopeptide (TPR) repeat protein
MIIFVGCAGERTAGPRGDVERIVTHQVHPGESWESIAVEFYRDGDRGDELAVYNGCEPDTPPAAGTGVRVPLTKDDLRGLEERLEAATAYNEGLDLARQGNYAEAVEQFQRALERDPRFDEATFNLAVTYQKLGLHEKAAAALRELTRRERGEAPYHFALGASLYHLGDFNGAKSAFERALAVDPNYHKALFSLAVVYEKLGEVDRARELWLEYLERSPDGEWSEEARARLKSLERSGGGNH